jgi:hypothetical protein
LAAGVGVERESEVRPDEPEADDRAFDDVLVGLAALLDAAGAGAREALELGAVVELGEPCRDSDVDGRARLCAGEDEAEALVDVRLAREDELAVLVELWGPGVADDDEARCVLAPAEVDAEDFVAGAGAVREA